MATWKKIITSGSTAELNHISASGNILPVTDNGSDLGSSGQEFKDLYIDGVAYLDSAQIGQLGAALDANNQAITNINVDGGAIDGTDIGANAAGTIAGTTIDASTDFTIGGTVITDSKITDDGTFTIDATTDIELNADGGDIIIKDGAAPVATININTISGSSISTGSFGLLQVDGADFTSASLASAIAGTGDFENFTVTADGGSNQTIANGNTLDIAGGTNITTAVGATDTVTVNLDNEIINSSLKAGRDSQNLIDFATTNNKIIFRVNNVNQVSLLDNVLGPEADSDVDLGTTAKRFKDAFVDSVTVTDNVTVGGNLTVNGTTTTIASTNTEVKDQFLLLASGSSETNLDAGIIVQSGSVAGTGSAFYHDISEERWAVGKEVDVGRQAATTHTQFVTTVKTSTSTPSATDGDYGVGEMWVDTDDSEPTGNGVVYIRTA